MTHIPQVVLQQQRLILQIRYLLFHINTQHDACPEIVTRTGTGSNLSASAPLSITFNEVPAYAVFVMWNSPSSSWYNNEYSFNNSPVAMSWLTTSWQSTNYNYSGAWNTTQGNFKKSSNSKTIYFYKSDSNLYNESGVKYVFFGI